MGQYNPVVFGKRLNSIPDAEPDTAKTRILGKETASGGGSTEAVG
jgi:hypothetical protein